MSKEALTLENLDAGQFIEQVNDAIAAASRALDNHSNPKAKAELTIKIAITNGDASGDFRVVTPSLSSKMPAPTPKPSLYPVQNLGGERRIVVDSEQDGDQMRMPGVADIRDARAAG